MKMVRSKNWMRGFGALTSAAILALAAGAVSAQAAEDPAANAPGHTLYGDPAVPDISGLWFGTSTTAPGLEDGQVATFGQNATHWAPWPPPLTPPYRKKADERIAAFKAGRAIGDLGARCLPFGMPVSLLIGAFPHEVVQTPGEVSIWEFGLFPIIIWTDGRPHPKDLKPSYNGHSIGYWIGDTLYADTVGVLGVTPLDPGARTPHSPKLHIQWTLQLVDKDTVHVHLILHDEDALTEPMVTTSIWRRKAGPDWQVLDDGSCFENNRNRPDASGATGFTKF